MLREPGYEGSELHVRERPIPGTSRSQFQTLQARPGTFPWKYGRGKPGTERGRYLEALFQAGSKFALVVEQAGMDGPGTVDWGKVGSSQWRDRGPGRLDAMNRWTKMTQDLGKLVTARLLRYCNENQTAAEIGKIYGIGSRAAAFVLESDLKAVAVYFGYLGRR